MRIYVVVTVSAFVLGGFVGGELTGNKFSLEGAAMGAFVIIAGIFSLSAYSRAQEEKRKNPGIHPKNR